MTTASGFLADILGPAGAQALRLAVDRNPDLQPVLVPRAALAWLQNQTSHQGTIPGTPGSYLEFRKSESGYSGVIGLPETRYEFENKPLEHLAAAVSLALGLVVSGRRPIRDLTAVRLQKSLDTLVKARGEELGKKVLDPNLGYSLREEHTPTGLKVHAHDRAGNHVGTQWFEHHPQGLKPVTVGVDDEHQRRGLASQMYDHQTRLTGKTILPGALQTDEGQAFRQGYKKTELPGQTAKPRQQTGPMEPQAPQKQPKKSMPSFRVAKTEVGAPCPDCGEPRWTGRRYTGCICWRDLQKSVQSKETPTAVVLECRGWASEAFLAFRKGFE